MIRLWRTKDKSLAIFSGSKRVDESDLSRKMMKRRRIRKSLNVPRFELVDVGDRCMNSKNTFLPKESELWISRELLLKFWRFQIFITNSVEIC